MINVAMLANLRPGKKLSEVEDCTNTVGLIAVVSLELLRHWRRRSEVGDSRDSERIGDTNTSSYNIFTRPVVSIFPNYLTHSLLSSKRTRG